MHRSKLSSVPLTLLVRHVRGAVGGGTTLVGAVEEGASTPTSCDTCEQQQ